MDVKRGHCWRCETSLDLDNQVTCSRCTVPAYCSKKCCTADDSRHSAECDVWGPKECNKCHVAGNFKECSGCLNVWYCGKECQRKDWRQHKIACKTSEEVMKSAESKIRENSSTKISINGVFVPNLYLDPHWMPTPPEPMPEPYYIGNAIALDMLNLENNECTTAYPATSSESHSALKKDYSILSVGCGNLRNWIHTVVSLPTAFQGKLHTALNDFDPFLQARNVLFLFMMIAFADKDDIAGIVTTIWYSLHLSQDHFEFLIGCLRTLAGISRADLMKQVRGIVDISEADLNLIRQVWRKWLQLECCRKSSRYINLRKQRAQMGVNRNIFKSTIMAIDEYKLELKAEYRESYTEWLENGIFLPTVKARNRYLPYGNPTLTGYRIRQGNEMRMNDQKFALSAPELIDFTYCVPPDLQPFGEWDHLLVKKHFPEMLPSLIDIYHCYITDQVRQAIVHLCTLRCRIAFIVCECSDRMLVRQAKKYDRIFTSNVADYVGLKTLLFALKNSLNEENKFATIITQHWRWYMFLPQCQVIGHESVSEGELQTAMIRAAEDTGITSRAWAPFPAGLQEYYNNTVHFKNYLRAEQTARNLPQGSPTVRWQDVREVDGLRLRDFSKGELNKVAPFQYRRNIRQVSMLRQHMSRMIEWYIP